MDRRRFFAKVTAAVSGIESLNQLRAFADSLPATPKMPALFLGHGSPMIALEENRFVREFRRIERTIPKPAAILCVSAHWFTRGLKVTAMTSPRTIHDFGGFPPQLYQVQYPASGSPDLANVTAELMSPDSVEMDQAWGLDHGAWTVLKHLYPAADIPIVQLSLDRTRKPEQHFELARRLDTLRSRGVLIIGSGNIVHNLSQIDFQNLNRRDHGYDWAREAQQLVNRQLRSGDYQPLVDYTRRGQAMRLAVPTPDHYLPLLYVLGLSHRPEQLSMFNDELVGGSISMTSVRIG